MYDPNATLYQAPGGAGDPNATLYQAPYDPNATLMGVPGGDPNATLYQAPGGAGDPNATLYQPPGYGEATFTGNGAPVYVNNSAFIQQQLSAPPQVVPHIKLVPHNSFFPTVERDVMKTVKFGREIGENDPECVYYNSRVVSKRHAEVWAVNGEFYIRDTRSQSGTFLNAMRLSPPGEESKPFKLKNGDTIQFGVDRRGEVAPDTKCVSVVVEVLFKKIAAPTPPSPQQYAPQQFSPQQYNAPQQYGQYGAPPPGYPPQQSSYSPQHSSYSPQQYTPPPHPYGIPPQQYGAPPQQYGAPPQQYGAPPQQYGQPPQQFGQQPPPQARPANLLDLTLLAGNASRAK